MTLTDEIQIDEYTTVDRERLKKMCTSFGCSEITQMRCIPRNGCADLCQECYDAMIEGDI